MAGLGVGGRGDGADMDVASASEGVSDVLVMCLASLLSSTEDGSPSPFAALGP